MGKKQLLFCHHYIRSGSAEEAADAAGVTLETALAWLEQPETVRQLKRLRHARDTAEGPPSAARQLSELAAGRSDDIVRLAFLESEAALSELESMDFSQLSAIKRLSNGTVELTLINKVEALKSLLENEGGGDAPLAPLIEALGNTIKPETGQDG